LVVGLLGNAAPVAPERNPARHAAARPYPAENFGVANSAEVFYQLNAYEGFGLF
jgi:hypothetical protein